MIHAVSSKHREAPFTCNIRTFFFVFEYFDATQLEHTVFGDVQWTALKSTITAEHGRWWFLKAFWRLKMFSYDKASLVNGHHAIPTNFVL